jgi:proline iminopeptidase
MKNALRIILSLYAILFVCTLHAQERYILTSDSVKLYVKVKGHGTPCLYIHGGPGAGSYFLEKLMGDSLEQHFQMIYLDQRGSGRSMSPKDNNYSLDRMIKDFEEVRTSLGIKQWLTIGHSFGGLLQMGYAKNHTNVIKGMIMINCSLNLNETFKSSWCPKACDLLGITDRRFYLDETLPIKVRWDSLIVQLVRKDIIWKMAFSSRNDMDMMNAACSEVPRGNVDFESIAFSINDYFADFKKETGTMKMPVLFFYGIKDWMIGPEHYKGVNFPNMMLWRNDMAHMSPFLGNNRTAVLKAIHTYSVKYKF